MVAVLIPVLRRGKLSHRARKWQGWNSNPDSLAETFALLIRLYCVCSRKNLDKGAETCQGFESGGGIQKTFNLAFR